MLTRKDVSVITKDKKTVLHLYCTENTLESHPIAELLIKKIPKLINLQDKSGYTALHLACQSDNPSLIKLLLSNGADVYSRDKKGKPPKDYILTPELKKSFKGTIYPICSFLFVDYYVSGYLLKKGAKGLIKAYKKRWFVMDEEYLHYYISPNVTLVERFANSNRNHKNKEV